MRRKQSRPVTNTRAQNQARQSQSLPALARSQRILLFPTMSAPSDPAAAVGHAPATEAATSSSALTFKLHPLVIVNVSDHYTRVKAQAACSGDSSSSSGAAAGQQPRVFGCVIGVQRGRTVEIFNSFELVLDPVTGTLDRSFLEKKQELCKMILESRDFVLVPGGTWNGRVLLVFDEYLFVW
jgi:hypothetical protein